MHPGDASSNLADSTTRVSFNGRTAVFQTADVGSIPIARSVPIVCPYRLGVRTSAPQVENAGANPARDALLPVLPEADTGLRSRLTRFDSSQGGEVFTLPPTWRTQARASEARRPGSTPGWGAVRMHQTVTARGRADLMPPPACHFRCAPRWMPGLISPRAGVRLPPQRRHSGVVQR